MEHDQSAENPLRDEFRIALERNQSNRVLSYVDADEQTIPLN